METATTPRRYIPLIQKPKCCAVTCLQMILYRNGHGLHDQEDLALEFGVKIEPEDVLAFREDMPILTSFNHDEGISTLDSVEAFNEFFKQKGIQLRAEAIRYADIDSLRDLLIKHLDDDHDVWIEYHSHEIASEHANNGRIHDALIESFDPASNTIVLIDPKPTRRQRHTTSLEMLDRALSSEYGRELGLIVVRKA